MGVSGVFFSDSGFPRSLPHEGDLPSWKNHLCSDRYSETSLQKFPLFSFPVTKVFKKNHPTPKSLVQPTPFHLAKRIILPPFCVLPLDWVCRQLELRFSFLFGFFVRTEKILTFFFSSFFSFFAPLRDYFLQGDPDLVFLPQRSGALHFFPLKGFPASRCLLPWPPAPAPPRSLWSCRTQKNFVPPPPRRSLLRILFRVPSPPTHALDYWRKFPRILFYFFSVLNFLAPSCRCTLPPGISS